MSFTKLSLSSIACLMLTLSACGSDVDTPDASVGRDATVVANPDATVVVHDDATVVNDDATVVNPDAEPVDSGVADTGVAEDTGVAADTGVAPDSGVAAAPVWADVYRGAISQSCSCHNNGGQSGGLTFPNARADIADVRAELEMERANERCGGTRHPRVTPGDAMSSLLYLKVAGSACGSRMPLGGGALAQAQQDLIRDWINGGAN